MTDLATDSEIEDLQTFRDRARAWLEETLPRFGLDEEDIGFGGEGGQQRAAKGKALQAALWEGRLAGITFPAAYGGLGLTLAHRDVFNEEVRAAGPKAVGLFNLLGIVWILGLGMIAPCMLDVASEEQKRTHISGMLRGEKLWAQMLSEPTGGSDLAGAITRATRDGEQFIINGSKVWTSAADVSDMGVLLARTNWDVPKHRGLTMFIVSLDNPGLTVLPLRLASGSTGFCQEFFDDMAVSADDVLGGIDDGWHVASRLLVHERHAVGGGSTFHVMSVGGTRREAPGGGDVSELADSVGRSEDPLVRQGAAELHVLSTVRGQLASRVVEGTALGVMPPAAGSLLRLFSGDLSTRVSDVEMAVAGPAAVAWPADRPGGASELGLRFLVRQGGSIASGTVEIQRNIIGERILGLPREPVADIDVPFNEVRHNAMPGALSRKQP